MNFAVSTHSFSLKPMTAHVLSTLFFLVAGHSIFNIASAQTTSEELWILPPTQTQSTQPPSDTLLPYCEDLQQSPKVPSGSTIGVGNTLTGVVNQELILKGRACIQRDNTKLQGDDVQYDYASEQVTVKGNARVNNPDGDTISGERIQYNLSSETGRVTPANFTVKASEGRGKAESLTILSGRRALLSQARYTTCQADDPDWYLKTDSLILDQDNDTATGRNGILVFKNIPVLATPYFKAPLGNRRQSGFLTPTYGYSTLNGTSISAPYYFNIAPNYDFTLTPQWLSERGVRFGGEYRYLTRWGQGSLYGDLLPRDEKTKTTRYYWHAQHSSQGVLGDGVWQANINARKMSDNNFIDDFSVQDWDGGARTMPSEYSLRYKRDGLSLRLRQKSYQTLQTSNNQVDAPYDFKPQFDLRYYKRWGNWLFNTQWESTRFAHDDVKNKAQGWRHIVYPSIAYEWRTPGAFIIPKLGVHMTKYDLSRVPLPVNANNITYNKSASRTLPIFSLDSGLILERQGKWFKQNIVQTLEPRIYYAHIPYKDQSNIWNFDSALADLDFSRIYSENLFTGGDRIAQANQVTAGISSRILKQDTGEELFQASLAQRYYFSKQDVNLSGTLENNNAHRKSDLLAAVSGKVSNQLWAQGFAQYNSDSGKLLRTDAAIRWQPAYRKVVNLGYHENKILTEPSKTAYVSAQWPVSLMSNNLYAVSRLNYDLNNKRLTDAWMGIEYVKDCWIFRFVGQRTVDTNNRVDNTFYLQLELKGLGNVGNRANQELNSLVDGYHPISFDHQN